MVISGREIVAKNGHEVVRFVPKDNAVSYLTDSLIGVLKEEYILDEIKTEILKEKYDIVC